MKNSGFAFGILMMGLCGATAPLTVSLALAQDEDGELVEDESGVSEDDKNFTHDQGQDAANQHSEYSEQVRMRQARLSGTGCASGTANAALSPDKRTLSILFSNYMVEAGGQGGLQRDLKACEVTIPFDVPLGFQVAIVKLDYRGFVSLPAGGQAALGALYRMSDQQSGKRYRRAFNRRTIFNGPMDDEFSLTSQIAAQDQWSQCGKSFSLHVNTRLLSQTNANQETAMAVLDSIDGQVQDKRVRYHLMWRRCQPGLRPPGNRPQPVPVRPQPGPVRPQPSPVRPQPPSVLPPRPVPPIPRPGRILGPGHPDQPNWGLIRRIGNV